MLQSYKSNPEGMLGICALLLTVTASKWRRVMAQCGAGNRVPDLNWTRGFL